MKYFMHTSITNIRALPSVNSKTQAVASAVDCQLYNTWFYAR